MREKAKKKRKKKAPTSVSLDRNGVASWGDKEDGELSDSSTHSTLLADTDDEYRLTINEMAVENQTNQDKQPDEAQLAENTTDANTADNNQKTDHNQKTNEEHNAAETTAATEDTSAATESQTNPDKLPDEAELTEYTTDANPADSNQKTDNNQKTNEEHKSAQTPAATDDTSAATAEETHQNAKDTLATDEAETAATNPDVGWIPTDHETDFTTVGTNCDKQSLFIANLDDNITENELLALFGLNATPDTRKWSSAEITYNGRGKYKVYAKLRTHYKFALEILKLNGMTFNHRELLIQPEKNPQKSKQSNRSNGKSHLPYNPRNALLAGGKNRGNPSSRVSNKQDRSTTTTSSGQVEPESSNQRKITGVWGNTLEEEGGNSLNSRPQQTMAETVRAKHLQIERRAKERRQLLFEISCKQGSIPERALPNAAIVYRALTEKLSLPNEPIVQAIEAIYAPNPNSPWSWCVLFNSENTRAKFEAKQTQLCWIDKTTEQEYIYTITTKGFRNGLTITFQSSPLIPDEEIRYYFRQFGRVKRINYIGHSFNRNIDSGLRKVILDLHEDCTPRDIPGFWTTSDGVERKLFFKGKVFFCAKCRRNHTYTEGCAEIGVVEGPAESTTQDSRQDAEPQRQQNNTTNKEQDTTQTGNKDEHKQETSETVKASFCGRESSTQEIRILSNEPSAVAQKQKEGFTDERGKDLTDFLNGLPEDSQGEFPNSPAVLITTIPETPMDAIANDSTTDMEASAKTAMETPPSKIDKVGGRQPAEELYRKAVENIKARSRAIPRLTQLLTKVPPNKPRTGIKR